MNCRWPKQQWWKLTLSLSNCQFRYSFTAIVITLLAWTLGGQFSLYTSGRVSCLHNRSYLRWTEQFTQVWLLHGPWVNFERIVHSKKDKMGCYQMRFDESGTALLMKTFSKALQSHSCFFHAISVIILRFCEVLQQRF